jgi:hypothetical protein
VDITIYEYTIEVIFCKMWHILPPKYLEFWFSMSVLIWIVSQGKFNAFSDTVEE